MVDAAETRRLGLDAGGAAHAKRLVERKGDRRVAAASLEACRERDGVFDGERRALREIGQHGMGGIAEERHAPVRPAVQWLQPKERPAAPALDHSRARPCRARPAMERRQQDFGLGAPGSILAWRCRLRPRRRCSRPFRRAPGNARDGRAARATARHWEHRRGRGLGRAAAAHARRWRRRSAGPRAGAMRSRKRDQIPSAAMRLEPSTCVPSAPLADDPARRGSRPPSRRSRL